MGYPINKVIFETFYNLNKMSKNKYSSKDVGKINKRDSKNISRSPIIKSTPSNTSVVITSPTDIRDILFSKNSEEQLDLNMRDLIFNVTDDHKTLINKNRKLAQFVINSTNKIASLNETIKNLEMSKTKEKEELLAKLDKISNNYRLFAESHQKLMKINSESEMTKSSIEIINKQLNSYEEFIKFTLLDFISNYKRIQNFVSLNTHCSINRLQSFISGLMEELRQSMNNFKIKLNKPQLFDVYFKEFDKISSESQRNDKKDPFPRPTSSNSNIRRPLTPELEISEKVSHSKNHTLEACNMPLPLKNINRVMKKNRQKSFDSSEKRFMDFMQNKTAVNNHDQEDLRSSSNSNSENRGLISRNNNNFFIPSNNSLLPAMNNNRSNIDKALMNSLSLSEGFDLINALKQKDSTNEEKKNDFSEEKKKVFCRAKVDFQPKRKSELQFKKGEIIELILINEEGMCQGVLNGKRGLFPLNYVERMD